MASFVFVDGYISIASVVLSAAGRQVALEGLAEPQDNTGFGNAARSRLGGLKDWTADVEFNQDHAAGNVDATLFPLIGTAVAVEFRPTSAAVGATNPKYTGTGLLVSYSPMGSGVGETAKAKARIVCSNGVALARATS